MTEFKKLLSQAGLTQRGYVALIDELAGAAPNINTVCNWAVGHTRTPPEAMAVLKLKISIQELLK